MINMFHNNVETVFGGRLLKTSTITSFCSMPAVISIAPHHASETKI